jgi:preprotein translocase SecE subunit
VAETKVTRIKASDDTPSKKKESKPVKSTPKAPKQKKAIFAPLRAIGGYFKGAWFELKQVRWPTRKATWSLTIAVLLFTTFIGVLIVLLDAFFNYLFKITIG